jgi:hypothetical protein
MAAPDDVGAALHFHQALGGEVTSDVERLGGPAARQSSCFRTGRDLIAFRAARRQDSCSAGGR